MLLKILISSLGSTQPLPRSAESWIQLLGRTRDLLNSHCCVPELVSSRCCSFGHRLCARTSQHPHHLSISPCSSRACHCSIQAVVGPTEGFVRSRLPLERIVSLDELEVSSLLVVAEACLQNISGLCLHEGQTAQEASLCASESPHRETDEAKLNDKLHIKGLHSHSTSDFALDFGYCELDKHKLKQRATDLGQSQSEKGQSKIVSPNLEKGLVEASLLITKAVVRHCERAAETI